MSRTIAKNCRVFLVHSAINFPSSAVAVAFFPRLEVSSNQLVMITALKSVYLSISSASGDVNVDVALVCATHGAAWKPYLRNGAMMWRSLAVILCREVYY